MNSSSRGTAAIFTDPARAAFRVIAAGLVAFMLAFGLATSPQAAASYSWACDPNFVWDDSGVNEVLTVAVDPDDPQHAVVLKWNITTAWIDPGYHGAWKHSARWRVYDPTAAGGGDWTDIEVDAWADPEGDCGAEFVIDGFDPGDEVQVKQLHGVWGWTPRPTVETFSVTTELPPPSGPVPDFDGLHLNGAEALAGADFKVVHDMAHDVPNSNPHTHGFVAYQDPAPGGDVLHGTTIIVGLYEPPEEERPELVPEPPTVQPDPPEDTDPGLVDEPDAGEGADTETEAVCTFDAEAEANKELLLAGFGDEAQTIPARIKALAAERDTLRTRAQSAEATVTAQAAKIAALEGSSGGAGGGPGVGNIEPEIDWEAIAGEWQAAFEEADQQRSDLADAEEDRRQTAEELRQAKADNAELLTRIAELLAKIDDLNERLDALTPATDPPATPTGLTATPVDVRGNLIDLTWDDPVDEVTGWVVYARPLKRLTTSTHPEWTTERTTLVAVERLGADARGTQFNAAGLGKAFAFRVAAVGEGGESDQSWPAGAKRNARGVWR